MDRFTPNQDILGPLLHHQIQFTSGNAQFLSDLIHEGRVYATLLHPSVCHL